MNEKNILNVPVPAAESRRSQGAVSTGKKLLQVLKRRGGDQTRTTDRAKRKVHIRFYSSKPVYQVALVGSFNRWSLFHHPLQRISSRAWEISMRLAPGRYRYKFLVENVRWELDPRAVTAPNDFGGYESILHVE